MAKGQASKEIVINKLLEVFDNSFIDGKDLRINMIEAGEPIQIKISLTAAKNIIEKGAILNASVSAPKEASAFDNPEPVKVKITESEAENVAKLLSALNL